MICKNCGKETTTRFCAYCGTENNADASVESISSEATNESQNIMTLEEKPVVNNQPVMNNQMYGGQPMMNNQMYGGQPMMNGQMNNQMYGGQPMMNGQMNNQMYGGQPMMNNQMYGGQPNTTYGLPPVDFPPKKKHPYHVGLGYIICLLSLIVGAVALFLPGATSEENIRNVNNMFIEYPDGVIIAIVIGLGFVFTLCYLPIMSLIDSLLFLALSVFELIDFMDKMSYYVDKGFISYGPALFMFVGASAVMVIGSIIYIINKSKHVVFIPRVNTNIMR